jgi:hypothetical protein
MSNRRLLLAFGLWAGMIASLGAALFALHSIIAEGDLANPKPIPWLVLMVCGNLFFFSLSGWAATSKGRHSPWLSRYVFNPIGKLLIAALLTTVVYFSVRLFASKDDALVLALLTGLGGVWGFVRHRFQFKV